MRYNINKDNIIIDKLCILQT